MRVCIWGLPGAGKSSLLPTLANALNLPAFDLDNLIIQEKQIPIARFFQLFGENYFRQTESQQLQSLFADHERFVLACGGGTPCFQENNALMLSNSVCIWLNPNIHIITHRMLSQNPHSRPVIQGQTKPSILKSLQNLLSNRVFYYQQAHIICTEESIEIAELAIKINSYWHYLRSIDNLQ